MCVLHRVFNGICIPYNGEDLVWHPVTPSMSSMGYQSPDASQNVELKRGNIGSFFKAKTSSKAGTATTKSPASAINSAERRSTASEENAAGNHTEVKAKVEASQQARLSTSGAHQSSADAVIETAGNGRQPGSSGTASIQASQDTALANAQNDAKVNLDSSIVDPVNDEDSKVEVTTDDVLNTDDAGGIGRCRELDVSCWPPMRLYIVKHWGVYALCLDDRLPWLHRLACTWSTQHMFT